jgi:hypothetical protein
MADQTGRDCSGDRASLAGRPYLEEGAKLIELAHGAQRLFAKQEAQEQRRLTPALGLNDSIRAAAVPTGVVLMLAASLVRCFRVGITQLAVAVAILVIFAVVLYLLSPWIVAIGNWNLVLFFAGMLGLGVLAGVPIAYCFRLSTVV